MPVTDSGDSPESDVRPLLTCQCTNNGTCGVLKGRTRNAHITLCIFRVVLGQKRQNSLRWVHLKVI